MDNEYFKSDCDCEHTVEIEISSNVDFAKINCKKCGGVYLYKISEYNIVKKLGQGQTGTVYLADTKDGKQVALKVLDASTDLDIAQFKRELTIQKDLHHKNIARSVDYVHWGSIYYIAMEYHPGKTLDQVLEEKGTLEAKEAIKIIINVLEGLDYASQKSVVHRDVKPENIYITSDGQVKILDMGLAKIIGRSYGITNSDIVKGSPVFMSPEQFEDTKTVDTRADIYSVGATLYNLLSGRCAFMEYSTILTLAHAKRDDKYRRLEATNDNIPDDLIYIVEKAMSPIGTRYQSVREMIDDLYGFYKKHYSKK